MIQTVSISALIFSLGMLLQLTRVIRAKNDWMFVIGSYTVGFLIASAILLSQNQISPTMSAFTYILIVTILNVGYFHVRLLPEVHELTIISVNFAIFSWLMHQYLISSTFSNFHILLLSIATISTFLVLLPIKISDIFQTFQYLWYTVANLFLTFILIQHALSQTILSFETFSISSVIQLILFGMMFMAIIPSLIFLTLIILFLLPTQSDTTRSKAMMLDGIFSSMAIRHQDIQNNSWFLSILVIIALAAYTVIITINPDSISFLIPITLLIVPTLGRWGKENKLTFD